MSEIPENIKDGLDIKPISVVDEALEIALLNPLIPIRKFIKINKSLQMSINVQSTVSKMNYSALSILFINITLFLFIN